MIQSLQVRAVVFRLWAVIGLVVLAVGTPAQACQKEGYVEYSRQRVGNTITVTCVRSEYYDRLKAIDRDLPALDKQITEDRAAVATWQGDLPDYMRSLDEWVKMDEKAREETRARAVEAVFVAVIQRLRVLSLQNIDITRKELDTLWQAFRSTPLGSPQFEDILQQQQAGLGIIRKWESREQLLEAMEKLYTGVHGLKELHREEYMHAVVQFLKLVPSDPQIVVLCNELDFTASALVGNATAWTARARVQQLVDLGGERLKGLSGVTKVYKEHVDRRKDLTNERAQMLADQ